MNDPKPPTREQRAAQLPSPRNSDLVMVPLELLPVYLELHKIQASYTTKIVIGREPYPLLHCREKKEN